MRALAALAACTALVAGCGNDTVPDWGYPELGKTLRSLSRDLDQACERTETPESCAKDLDRLTAPAERAFAQVLEHKLLDADTVAAMNELDRAREARVAAAEQARTRRDPHHHPLARAVAAEKLAYEHLLAELERLRTAPPPGDGTDPV
ncbi:hypothetical protein [Streptomyces xanthophaeus]|uniref:hypothetical protein n=1 Tax=Streptomyces xanthophaeus TaxID=67385 RepID=UPI002647A227|nr:hypothetical protein [Streptomyces xanthophaeus]WKD30971.1 hypothetical protein KO717_02600 [Streptomyces xanthophaeus]